MSSVGVSLEGNIIHATYMGTMTLDLVKEGEKQIEEWIPRVQSPVVLYDTRLMDPPNIRLAMEMKAFDNRIASRVGRCATVVKDAATAFFAKVAFVFTREHRVFYHDLDGARAWLLGQNTANPA